MTTAAKQVAVIVSSTTGLVPRIDLVSQAKDLVVRQILRNPYPNDWQAIKVDWPEDWPHRLDEDDVKIPTTIKCEWMRNLRRRVLNYFLRQAQLYQVVVESRVEGFYLFYRRR